MLHQGSLRALVMLLAVASVAQAQTSRASSASSYIERGNKWLAKGDWDHAIEDYDLAIAFDARATAYYNRGLAKQHKGDLDGAIGDYNRTIEIDPRYYPT